MAKTKSAPSMGKKADTTDKPVGAGDDHQVMPQPGKVDTKPMKKKQIAVKKVVPVQGEEKKGKKVSSALRPQTEPKKGKNPPQVPKKVVNTAAISVQGQQKKTKKPGNNLGNMTAPQQNKTKKKINNYKAAPVPEGGAGPQQADAEKPKKKKNRGRRGKNPSPMAQVQPEVDDDDCVAVEKECGWDVGIEEKVEDNVERLWRDSRFSLHFTEASTRTFVRAMLRLEYVTGDKPSEGDLEEEEFRTNLSFCRQSVLANMKKKKLSKARKHHSDTCPECSAVFLLMVDNRFQKETELYTALCDTMDFYDGLDVCGRHSILRSKVVGGLYRHDDMFGAFELQEVYYDNYVYDDFGFDPEINK